MAARSDKQADITIRNGRVISPASNLDFIGDVAILDSRVVAVGQNLDLSTKSEFDATGCLVTPGLIDCHVHGYEHCTPLGVNVDSTCLRRGVTTAVDAGSSGASTFPGLRKFIDDLSDTRVLAFLHIAGHGLAAAGCSAGAAGGECDSLHVVDVDECVRCIEQNRDMIVGVKVRLSSDVTRKGQFEEEVYRRALEASRRADVPLMVHHTLSTIPTQRDNSSGMACPGDMRKGDIYTHTFSCHGNSIADSVRQEIYPDVVEARRRGVLFDCGHGQGSFDWTLAELAARQSFYPDIISTDLHTGNKDGPVYDLLTVMTKFLFLGMPLVEVIRATTATPAGAIGMDGKLGSLEVGREADVTVMRLDEWDGQLEDCEGQLRKMASRLKPVAVWRAGRQFEIIDKSTKCPD